MLYGIPMSTSKGKLLVIAGALATTFAAGSCAKDPGVLEVASPRPAQPALCDLLPSASELPTGWSPGIRNVAAQPDSYTGEGFNCMMQVRVEAPNGQEEGDASVEVNVSRFRTEPEAAAAFDMNVRDLESMPSSESELPLLPGVDEALFVRNSGMSFLTWRKYNVVTGVTVAPDLISIDELLEAQASIIEKVN